LSHLKSRKFRVAVIAVLVNLLVTAIPELAPHRDVLILAVTALASVLVYAIAHEDAAALQSAGEAASLSNEQAMEDIRETIRETVGELLEEMFKSAPPKQ
jgi:hypothetical protein